MQLSKVRIEGFRSYTAAQVVDLRPKPHGLYCVTGKNQVDERLGSNGVGKSTILDAVTWCLYGTTAQGHSGPLVENAQKEHPCTVRVAFDVGSNSYEILRTRNPNALSVAENGGEPSRCAQEDIDYIVGMDYQLWMLCVVANNPEGSFFDMTPAPRLGLFSRILDLSLWEECAQRATKLRDEYEDAQDAADTKRDKKSVRREQLLEEQKALHAQIESDNKTAAQKRKRVNSKLRAAHKEVQDIELRIQNLTHDHEAASAFTDAFRALRDSAETAYQQADKKLSAAEAQTVVRRKVLRDVKQRIAEVGQVCEYCAGDLEKAQADLDAAEKAEQTQRAAVNELHREATAAQNEYKSSDLVRAKARSELLSAGNALQAVKSQVEFLCREKKSMKGDPKPTAAQKRLEVVVSRSAALHSECEALVKESKQAARVANDYDFWVNEYKKLRLWVINSALYQLEVLVNSNMQQLGFDNWGVQFLVTKETKSGKKSAGLHAIIIPLDDPELEIPWKQVSAGEAQRLRLAVMAGLMDLVRDRSGAEVDTEFWDEPSNHLSGQGLDDMLQFLRSRAQGGRHVWLVDHTALAFPFDHVLMVRKNQDGSTVSC